MAIALFGGTTIQPLEANISASQQKTVFDFRSNNSGSYIYSGSNPDLIFDGTASHHLSSLTFEDSGSTFSFVFSGSGFGEPKAALPGTTLSASINGLTSANDIAATFTASVVAATNMTASIIYYSGSNQIPTTGSGNVVILTNSAYSSSATTTSSFSPGTLGTYTTQIGHPSGYLSGSDTTGSLTVSGNFEVKDGGTVTLGVKPDLIDVSQSGDYTLTGILNASQIKTDELIIPESSDGSVLGSGSLVGGNTLISSSYGGNSSNPVFLTRVSGGSPNHYGHLYIATQSLGSPNWFAVSSSNSNDDGNFRFFVLRTTV